MSLLVVGFIKAEVILSYLGPRRAGGPGELGHDAGRGAERADPRLLVAARRGHGVHGGVRHRVLADGRCAGATRSIPSCGARSERARRSDAARGHPADPAGRPFRIDIGSTASTAARRARSRAGGGRRQLRHPREHHRRAGRRIGLRQERDRDVDPQPAARQRRAPRRHRVPGPRPAAGLAARAAGAARQRDRLRVPGSDDLAEPGVQRRRSSWPSRCGGTSGCRAARRSSAPRRCWSRSACRSRSGAWPAIRTSCRAASSSA